LVERLLCKERVRSSSLLVSTTAANANRRSRDHPSYSDKIHRPARAGHHRAPDPCPSVATAGHRPADRWTTSDPWVEPSGGLTPVGPHLNNWIVFGRNEESSISPSSQGNDPDRSQPVTDHLVRGWRGSSYKGHGVDALAPRADEGRGRLRKASGSREQTVIRRCPNGETRLG
jgi:hypothetical protein